MVVVVGAAGDDRTDVEALIVVMRASAGRGGDVGLAWAWDWDVGDTLLLLLLLLEPPFGCDTGDRAGVRGPDLEPMGLCIADRMMGQWAEEGSEAAARPPVIRNARVSSMVDGGFVSVI